MKIDKKIKEIRELQKIIDHRTAVENQAMQLIGECRFEEADTLLVDAIEAYRRRMGVYPERVPAETIYRNKENRKYCQSRGIRMSGPRLGRPPADQGKVKAAKRAEKRAKEI